MEPCLLCGGSVSYHFPVSAREDFSVISVISGGQFNRTGTPTVPMPHWYKAGGTNLVGPHYIFFSHCRQVERRKQRDPDLASVRVPGELQVYWEFRGLIRKIWFVRQQDNGFAGGNAAQSFSQVSRSAEHVIHAGEPEASAIALKSRSTGLPVPGCRRIGVRGLRTPGRY